MLEDTQEKESEEEQLDDTPDIEDIIADAASENMPEFVMKSLREEEKRRQKLHENVIIIDWFKNCDIEMWLLFSYIYLL